MRSFQHWNQDAKDKFREVLSSGNTKSLIEEFVNTEFTDVNTATNKFTAILNSAIEKVFSPQPKKSKEINKPKALLFLRLPAGKEGFQKSTTAA